MFEKFLGNQSIDDIEPSKRTLDQIVGDVSSKAIESLKYEKKSKKMVDNLIVVTSASGGAGASTVVANMVYELSKEFDICVIDLNIIFPTQYIYMGIDQTSSSMPSKDLVDLLTGECSIGEAIVPCKKSGVVGSKSSSNVGLLYAKNRSLIDKIDIEEKSAIDNMTDILLRLRDLYDLVIVDCPMDLQHGAVNNILYLCDHIYLVWDEGISSIVNTERIRKNAMKCGIDTFSKMSIILNKRTNIQYTKSPVQRLNMRLDGVLPFSSEIIDASLSGVVFCDKYASSKKASNVFARSIRGLCEVVKSDGGMIG